MISLATNPVLLKELRNRLRVNRAFIVLTIYLFVLTTCVGLVFLSYIISGNYASRPGVPPAIGRSVFVTVVGLELLIICFLSPALTAGSIASERERQTLDLLRTTLLSSRALVFGKLISALSYTFLLLFAALPLQSVAFLFGGIALGEVLVGTILLIVSALAFSSLGLFFSSFSRRTLVSTVLAYGSVLVLVFGLPVMTISSLPFFEIIVGGIIDQITMASGILVVAFAWLVVATNPLATAVLTEVIFLQEGSLTHFSLPIRDDFSLIFISPWIGYSVFYLLLSAVLITASIRIVNRADD